MTKRKVNVWNPWRNRQTRIQFIAGFNVVAALLWFVSYRKLREKQYLLSITAPGTFYTEEDLQEAGFDVLEVNRQHLADRAQHRAEELAAMRESPVEHQDE